MLLNPLSFLFVAMMSIPILQSLAEMSTKRRLALVTFFLQSSPAARYKQFCSVVTAGTYEKYPPPVIKPDEQYLTDFLDSLEVVGPSTATLHTHKSGLAQRDHFGRIFPQPRTIRIPSDAWGEQQQLLQCIRVAGMQADAGVALYQQLQQRLQVASPAAIASARNKILTLFKLLLKRREALQPGTLQHDAALSLSRTALEALAKAQAKEGQQHYNLKELEAMEKLLVAREYQREGLQDMAMNSFQEICRNQAASSKTRLQALKVLCSSGEEQGDSSILQSLVTAMQGEQQYQQMLLQTIQKIKDRVGG